MTEINNEKLNNTPLIVDGVIGKAYKFTGIDIIKAGSLKAFNKSTELTFSVWLIFENNTNCSTPALTAFAENNSFCITAKGMTVNNNGEIKEYPFTLNSGEWTHFAFIIKEGKLISYINGKKVVVGDSFSMPSFDLYLGGNNITNEYTCCTIDEICMYGEYLKEMQIRKLANREKVPGKMLYYNSCDSISEFSSCVI